MAHTNIRAIRQRRRVRRVRKKVNGDAARPRLAISRSHRNIHAQIIDDMSRKTLCSVSSMSKSIREQCAYGGNNAAATIVGKAIGELAREQGIETVCFDRRGRRFHGRVKAAAQAARDAGLKF